MYALLLMLGAIAACITMAPGLQNALKKVTSEIMITHSAEYLFSSLLEIFFTGIRLFL